MYEAEFVRQVAALQPLRMITEILEIPREQEEFVLRVTNENFGIEDPEFQRPGESTAERLGFLQEAFAFLDEITQERRRQPRNDLSTVLAQASVANRCRSSSCSLSTSSSWSPVTTPPATPSRAACWR